MSFSSRAAVAVIALMSLAGCAASQSTLHPSFGVAVKEDIAAQLADPDANYVKAPPPADGARANLMMTRYREGRTAKPIASASDVGGAAAASGGGAGATP